MAILPLDIITIILTKLPSKSLARCKCVSKSWNSLINSPQFIALHLTHSLSSNNRLLILNYGTHLESTPFKLLGSHFEGDSIIISKFDVPICYSGQEVSICGSINGLVSLVLKNVDDPNLLSVVFWNPSMNTHFLLPDDDGVGGGGVAYCFCCTGGVGDGNSGDGGGCSGCGGDGDGDGGCNGGDGGCSGGDGNCNGGDGGCSGGGDDGVGDGDEEDDDDGGADDKILGVSFGFGYDSANDDYKIVKILDKFRPFHDGGGVDVEEAASGGDGDGEAGVEDEGESDNGDDDEDEAEGSDDDDEENVGRNHEYDHSQCKVGFIYREVRVYSLRNHTWKRVHYLYTGDKMEWYCPGAVINNHIVHWIFWNYMKKEPKLRGFDLSSFQWTKVGLPNFRGDDNYNIIGLTDDDNDEVLAGFEISDFVVLGVLDECLCVVTRICPEFDSAYVWVMKEYGVQESWTKLFNVVEAGIVGPLLSAPLVCSNGGDEVLLRRENEDGLCLYDLTEKSVKDVPKLPTSLKLRDVNLCVESLVPVAKMIDGAHESIEGS